MTKIPSNIKPTRTLEIEQALEIVFSWLEEAHGYLSESYIMTEEESINNMLEKLEGFIENFDNFYPSQATIVYTTVEYPNTLSILPPLDNAEIILRAANATLKNIRKTLETLRNTTLVLKNNVHKKEGYTEYLIEKLDEILEAK